MKFLEKFRPLKHLYSSHEAYLKILKRLKRIKDSHKYRAAGVKPTLIVKEILQEFFMKKPTDQRSNRFVMVIDCILNQNSRDTGAASYPAMNKKILGLCMRYDVGICQIPCPEMAFLGFLRKRKQGQSIRDAMDTEAGRDCCRKLSVETADKIQDYIQNKNKILAVLGGNPESPGCAIHTVSSNKMNEMNGSIAYNSGVFIKEFHKELCKRNIDIPFKGMRDCKPEWIKQDLEWLENIFNQK